MIPYTSQISTTTALAGSITSDALTTAGTVVGLVLGVAVFLAGIGFAWRKLQKYAIGRKF